MNPVGSISVGPTDRAVEVGSFSLEEDDDTLFVDVQQMSPNQVWNYSYGLLWWESSFGRELGTEKVYGHQVGETYKLGIGRSPRSRSGRIMFAPRAYNRRWISIENPPTWTLSISAESAKSNSGALPDIPAFGTRSTLGVLSDLVGAGVSYAITGSDTPYALIKLIK
jgi:hypothetical protein